MISLAPPSSTRAGQFPWPLAWLIALVALVAREPVMLVVLGLVAVAGLVAETTGRVAQARLRLRVSLSASRVVAGEEVDCVVEVDNAKPMPLTWCDVHIPLPEGVELADAGPGHARSRLAATFGIGANERVRFRFRVLAAQRGAYAIGAARIRTGDWLGFFSDERDAGELAVLVVYPRPLQARMRDVPAFRPLAERATRRGLLTDPTRFAGVREHRAGDARKDIHWKASARTGRLQTRVFDPSTSGDVVFLVNVASHPSYWIQADPDAVEAAISAASTLLRQAEEEGRRAALVTNGIDAVTRERPRARLGRGPARLRRGLEILARLSPYAVGTPERIFLREQARLAFGATLVCVTPSITAALARALARLRRGRHRVLAVSVAPIADDIAAYCGARRVDTQELGYGRRRRAI
ncbi:MAG TPA: DUF58 domain-containing protein [Candidatus Dormibacteraeota bacterium]|nr:DUF58 domain-containing protein [Candidatus Dormibacteraeota bacterium]